MAFSTGVGIAAGGLLLAASLALFIFQRMSPSWSRPVRVLASLGAAALLVVGSSLLARTLFVRAFGASDTVGSMLGAALVAVALAAAMRLQLGASSRLPGPPSGGTDWRWVLQLIDLTDLTELHQFALDRLVAVVHARGGAILLADPAGSTFTVTHSTSHEDLREHPTVLAADAPLPTLAGKRRGPIRCANVGLGSRRVAGVLSDFDALRAELVIPLIVRGRLLGVVAFARCRDKEGYADEAVEQAMAEAELIAAVIDNVRVYNLALQEKFRAGVLLEQLTLGVLAADHSGTIVACNLAARRILALSKSPEGRSAEAFGPALGALLGPQALGREEVVTQEMVLDLKGRGEVPVRVRAATVRGALDVPGRLLLIEDLSERRALELELGQARRLASVGTIAAEMAHEIRNPLVSIKTFSQLLPERLNDQEFQLRFSRVAQREVDAISRIIERLLDYAGPTELVREPTRLEDLIGEVIELLSPELRAQKIDVETDFAADAPRIAINRDKIKQVLRNVATNAVQAMPSGGTLRFTTSMRGEEGSSMPTTYRIAVVDTGCGIPKDKLASVFNPFFTTRKRGFGLGLSLARHVMEEHGGSIDINSKPDQGTTATLIFPLIHSIENLEKPAVRA